MYTEGQLLIHAGWMSGCGIVKFVRPAGLNCYRSWQGVYWDAQTAEVLGADGKIRKVKFDNLRPLTIKRLTAERLYISSKTWYQIPDLFREELLSMV